VNDRERGTVKFYNYAKQNGFIMPDDGSADVFVHARTLEMSGIATLSTGDRVEFERVPDNRGFQAYRIEFV
jgi:cold shock protein